MLLEQKCPRCGGPVTILVDEYFDWDCPACKLAIKIWGETGRVSASSPIDKWYEEPWVMPFLESFQPKKD